MSVTSEVPRRLADLRGRRLAVRLLVATGLGFFAFNMQDVLLEPYGGEILQLERRADDDADGHRGGWGVRSPS
jgi:hypothetical protein